MAEVGFVPVRGNINEIANTPKQDGQFLFTTESNANNKMYADVLRDDGTVERIIMVGDYIGEDGGVVDGNVTFNGQVELNDTTTFRTTNGIDVALQEIFKHVYPVGSIYMSTNNVNPSTLFGGSWTAWGSGKVPVGVDVNDSDFNTVEKTNGVKSNTYTPSGTVGNTTLSVSQMPAHYHMEFANEAGYDADNIIRENTQPTRSAVANYSSNSTYSIQGTSTDASVGRTSTVGGNQSHTHTFTGNSTTQSNLQPYITCYMWKRVI